MAMQLIKKKKKLARPLLQLKSELALQFPEEKASKSPALFDLPAAGQRTPLTRL